MTIRVLLSHISVSRGKASLPAVAEATRPMTYRSWVGRVGVSLVWELLTAGFPRHCTCAHKRGRASRSLRLAAWKAWLLEDSPWFRKLQLTCSGAVPESEKNLHPCVKFKGMCSSCSNPPMVVKQRQLADSTSVEQIRWSLAQAARVCVLLSAHLVSFFPPFTRDSGSTLAAAIGKKKRPR